MKKNAKALSAIMAATMGITSAAGTITAFADANIDVLYNTAFNAVETAKKEKTQVAINNARKAVRELNTSLAGDKKLQAELVGTLSGQLDPLQQNLFVAFYALTYEADKVTPKKAISQKEVNEARRYINGFAGAEENKDYITSWSSFVDKFQQNLINEATAALKTAETTKTAADAVKAQMLIDELLTVEDNEAVKTHAEQLKVQIEALLKGIVVEGAEAKTISTVVKSTVKNYENTVYQGENALVQAKVYDKDGKPIANKQVVISIKEQTANDRNVAIKNDVVVATNGEGIATFVIATERLFGEAGVKITDTSEAATYEVAVAGSESESKVKTTGEVRFAQVQLGNIDLTKKMYDDKHLVPGKNAEANYTAEYTYDMNGNYAAYVSSQQVSASNTKDNALTFDATPWVSIATTKKATEIKTYKKDLSDIKSGKIVPNQTIDKYIEDIPAGLKYATMYFKDLKVSDRSELRITAYNAWTDKAIRETQVKPGQYNDTNFAYQVPVLKDVPVYVEVELVAPGGVDTALEDGFQLDRIEGVYDTQKYAAHDWEELQGATIDWTTEKTIYSDEVTMSTKEAQDIMGASYDATCKYQYRVPVFPQTGNAIITVKDKNNVVEEYYSWPTVNRYNDVKKEYDNVNVLAPKTAKDNVVPVLLSKDEANDAVGNVAADGFQVTVNSEKSGTTLVKGVIKAEGISQDIFNDTNNTIYTSVNWAPLPTETANQKFKAIIGQQIEVVAQLTDVNGNKVSTKDVAIGWSDSSVTDVSVLRKENKTDANGQAKMVLSTGDYTKCVKGLTASASNGYKIKLLVNGQEASSADLFWVALGLSYDPTLAANDETTPAYGTTETVQKDAPKLNAGENWKFGYRLFGIDAECFDANKKEIKKYTVTGVDIDYKLVAGVGSLTDNGEIFTLASTAAGISEVIGQVGKVTDKVAIYDKSIKKEYTNSGKGDHSAYSVLDMPVSWETFGQNQQIIMPQGSNIAYTEGNTVAFVKVTDKSGNPIKNEVVNVTIDGNGAQTQAEAKTDADGICRVVINNARGQVVSQSVVKVTVGTGKDKQELSRTINWVRPIGAGFQLVDIAKDSSKTTDVLNLTFSQNVNRESIDISQFDVMCTEKNNAGLDVIKAYKVKDFTVNGNVISLTMDNSNAKIADGVVSVGFKAASFIGGSNAGINYVISDLYGRALPNGNTIKLQNPNNTQLKAKFDEATRTITVDNSGVNGAQFTFVSSVEGLINNGVVSQTGNTLVLNQTTQFAMGTVTVYCNGVKSEVFVKVNAGASTDATTIATNAVIKAEGSKTQVDHDAAKKLVDALPAGSVKDGLLARLVLVQNAINAGATNADLVAAKAELTKLVNEINANSANYTPASWATFAPIFKAQQDIANAEGSTVAIVKQVIANIKKEAESLVLSDAAKIAKFKVDYATILAKTETTVKIADETTITAALAELAADATMAAGLTEQKTLLEKLQTKVVDLKADVTGLLNTEVAKIVVANYQGLKVDEFTDANKKAAVEAIAKKVTFSEGVTFVVSADGATITLSKDGITKDVATTATFVLSDAARADADANAFKAKYKDILAKTIDKIVDGDDATVTTAIAELGKLSAEAKAKLTAELTTLNKLDQACKDLATLKAEAGKYEDAATIEASVAAGSDVTANVKKITGVADEKVKVTVAFDTTGYLMTSGNAIVLVQKASGSAATTKVTLTFELNGVKLPKEVTVTIAIA